MSQRTRLVLDGEWNFWVDPEVSLTPNELMIDDALSITVPSPWQSCSPELRYYSGVGWYRKIVDIPASWLTGERAIILGIDAADYYTEAWLNGIKVGKHEGGYLPFEFDLTQAAQPGENILTIRVDDPPALFSEIPHGKQGWYGPLSGIWQSVWLEARAPVHIKGVQIITDLESGCVQGKVTLSGTVTDPHIVKGQVIDPGGKVVATTQVRLLTLDEKDYANQQSINDSKSQAPVILLSFLVPQPKAWSPDQPWLYSLKIQLQNGQVLDSLTRQIGFRAITTREGKLFLNGEPLYLRGALDQDYYPDLICTPPTEAFLEDQIHKAKELGLNCLRVHIKVADPRYYDLADRLGMLIWTELPNWTVFSEMAGKRGRATLQGILERDGHHPSIIVWTIINEDWGTDLVNEPSHRAWLKETFRWLKALDPTRLIVDNSPCEPNFHIQTDIEDYHFYRAIPDHRRDWDQFVQEFASRSSWTFCANGDAVRTGNEPLIVSEFGNWGLPDVELLQDEQGREPWWFETGFEWSEGVVYPQGVRTRFHSLGLERVFGSLEKFVEATQWQQLLALKYQIEAMRRQEGISGYVITELTDVHWECNGLLDMHRNPKTFHKEFAAINTDTVIIPDWVRVAYWSGEVIQTGITIAHGAGQPMRGAKVYWRLSGGEASGEINLMDQYAGQVVTAGDITFPAPETSIATIQRLELELRTAAGDLLASNYLDLTIFPRWMGPFGGNPLLAEQITLFTPDVQLAHQLESLGYRISSDLQTAQVAITDTVDQSWIRYIHQGGRLLALTGQNGQAGLILPRINLVARGKTSWSGDWASSFSWINRKGPFKRLPGGPLIDHSFDNIIPDYVLTGFRDWEFHANVPAGICVGWVHKPAALIGERFYGNGKAVINTFKINTLSLGQDPTATVLMDALIQSTHT